MKDIIARLIDFLKIKGGLASYAEIIAAGFSKIDIRSARVSGKVQKIDRGLYKLSGGSFVSSPDLVAVLIKVPQGVICLLSALSFHAATSEIPHRIDIAIPRGKHANKIKYPPVRFYRIAPDIWGTGVEEHIMGGRKIKIYSLARTVVDCFKFRNKIGIDVAREALKMAISEKAIKPKEIMRYAKLCRVDNIIKPILEALL